MPLLNEYLRLRNDQARELTWSELDANFLYVANAWSPQRHYVVGNIIYYYVEPNTSNSFQGGYSWYRAKVDNGPVSNFNIANWDPIGAATNSLSQITVINGLSSDNTINTLDFSSTDFTVSFASGVASISLNANSNIYWLSAGDAAIGTGNNNVPAIHTGSVVIGSGTFPSAYQLAVYGTTNITGNLTVGGTINSVPLATFYSNYGTHTHTTVPVTYPGYAGLYPTSITALADFDINSGTLVTGHTLSWNSTSKKWVNVAASTSSLAGLTDVTISAATDLQILVYNGGTNKWVNTTVVTDGTTGFSTPPLVHNHDTRYYTKTNLQTSGQAIVNWNNINSLPSDATQYIVATAPATNSPFAKPNYKVLSSGNNSITITNNTNGIDIRVNASSLTNNINFLAAGSLVAAAPGINFVDTASNTFSVALVGSNVDVSATSLHRYYVDNVLLSTRTDTEFIAPTQPPSANSANVTFSVADNVAGNGRTRVTAIARPGVSINSTIQANARQIIGFNDTSTIGWTATDDSGNDRIVITANYIGATGAVSVLNNGVGIGTFPTINFDNTTSVLWSIADAGGGQVNVSASCLPDLQAVTTQGNTTTDNIEITTPADVTGLSPTYVGGIILRSPDGTKRFLLTVDNSGNLITTLLP